VAISIAIVASFFLELVQVSLWSVSPKRSLFEVQVKSSCL